MSHALSIQGQPLVGCYECNAVLAQGFIFLDERGGKVDVCQDDPLSIMLKTSCYKFLLEEKKRLGVSDRQAWLDQDLRGGSER